MIVKRNKRCNKCDSNEKENSRSTHHSMEFIAEENDQHKEDDDRDWQDKFLQLRKTQQQFEDHSKEIEAKMQKKRKQMKEKEDEEKLFTCECLGINKHYSCHSKLALEERKKMKRE